MVDFDAIFTYSENCRRVLRATLEANADVWERPLVAPLIEFKTIREVVAHAASAEERWIMMRIGGRPVEWYMDRAPKSIEGVFADWDRNRTVTREYVDSLNESDFQRIYRIKLGDVWEGDLTVEQILFHILNHETHHRGQVSMALQQFGIDPPDFDFIFHHA